MACLPFHVLRAALHRDKYTAIAERIRDNTEQVLEAAEAVEPQHGTSVPSEVAGTEVKLDGKEYKILNSDDILAIIG